MNHAKVVTTFCGSVASYLLGGFDYLMQALMLLMLLDYLTGLIVAGVFQRSKKSTNGGLNSFVGWMGLAKKFMVLVFIVIAVQMDILMNMTYIRNAAITFFAINEVLSVIENAGLMGVPVPQVIAQAVDVLSKKEAVEVEKNEL